MSNNEEIIIRLKEILPSKGERTKTLAGKISLLLMQLPALVNYIGEKNEKLKNDIFYDLGRYIQHHRFKKGKIIQHLSQNDNYFYMIVTGTVAKLSIQYKKINMSFKEYILHLTKLQLLEEYFLMCNCIEKNKEIFPFKVEKNMIKLFQQIQVFNFDEELKKLIIYIKNSKWENGHKDINDFLELINPEILNGKEYFLSKDMKFPILIPHYIKKQILEPNSFIGYLFKSKGIKEFSAYICINNADVLYIDKSLFPPGCRLINIFEKRFNYSLIDNIFKKYIIFENTSIDFLTKNYSNYFRLIPVKKGEKLVIQGSPHEGIFFVNKGEFQLRTIKSYYELQELIFSLRDSLDTFKNYISYIKKREIDDLNDKVNYLKNNDIYKNPLFILKASEKSDIIFATYHSPQIVGLNEFYDNKTGINHFSLYCISDEAEVYFLPKELVKNLLSIDSIYKSIATMVEEKVQNLIFGIKKYKVLYEAQFIKYISLPKITNQNNNNNSITEKKNTVLFSPLFQKNQESKNSNDEDNNMKIKNLNMIPMQFNSDIINKPKYNILKKKLFNYSLKKNRLGIKLNNDSKNIFSLISIKGNKHFSTKSTNKKFDFPDKNERTKKLNISLPQEDIKKKKGRLIKVNSNLDIRKNIINLIKNDSMDKNISFSNEYDGYSKNGKIFDSLFQRKSIFNYQGRNQNNIKKIKLKSISNLKLSQFNEKSLVNDDNSKNEEETINNVNNINNNIQENEKGKENTINEINRKSININALENIYNKNNDLNQKKLFILNGKNITFRNSLANITDISKLNFNFNLINPSK